MSFQMRFVAYYFVAALALILVHHSTSAQQVLPDTKIKTNISSLYNSIDQIKQLQPKRFEYNTVAFSNLNLPSGKYYGFLAEEFGQVFPHMIRRESRSYLVGKNSYQTAIIKSVELEKLVPVLVSAIQEQQAMIEELRQELDALKSKALE